MSDRVLAFMVGLFTPTIIILALVTKTPAAPNHAPVKTINDLLEHDPLIRESECFAYWNKFKPK